MSRLLPAALLALLALPAGAGPYDGLYRPNSDWAMGWDCRRVGEAGGALEVSGARLTSVGTVCALSAPVEVRGMAATLFDARCTVEGAVTQARIMLMKHPFGLYVIRDGFVADWISCDQGADTEGPTPAGGD